MPTALVTGINGFTGKHLVPELQRAGFAVSGIAQETSAAPGVAVFVCDLTDPHATLKIVTHVCPDIVIHLAGIAFAAHDDVDAVYRANILGTRNLLASLACCKRTPRAVLLASSANIYGNADITPITEDTPLAPANDYAVSKLAMEYMARLWLDRLPITLVRPFNYTGQGQSLQFLLPKIVDHFKRRSDTIELGNLEVVRDFSDVRSVVQAYCLLIDSASTGHTYNVCSGVGHSLQEIISIMRDLSGHDLEVLANAAFVRKNEVHKLIGSRERLDAAIGPIDWIPIRETLSWMFEAEK